MRLPSRISSRTTRLFQGRRRPRRPAPACTAAPCPRAGTRRTMRVLAARWMASARACLPAVCLRCGTRSRSVLRKISMSGLSARRRGSSLAARPAFCAQLLDHLDDRDDLLVGEHDGLRAFVFGHLAGEALDHGDRVARAGDDQVEVALFHLRVRRHDDQSPSTRPTRTAPVGLQERDVRDVQGGAGADHAAGRRGRSRGRTTGADAMICTSYESRRGTAAGWAGRSGGEVRISLVVGRPSRLMKPPGNLPAA